jgi:hypothetical protein
MVVAFNPIKQDFSAVALDQPPFDVELEEKILGGVVLDKEALARIIDIIPSPDAFHIQDHKRIYQAALVLHHQGAPVDLMTVTMWLHEHGQLEAIGGQNRLANLVESTVETINIDHYAKKLSELWQRRQLVEAAHETAKLATDPMAPLSEASERLQEHLKRLGNPTPETVRRITQLIESNPNPVEQEEALSKLAKETGRQLREIKELHDILEADWEKEDSAEERKQEIQQLESFKERTLTLSKYLPESYAKPMTEMAQWMEAPTAAFMTIKLAAFASCLHPQTRIAVKKSIGFIEPAIVYGGIVTESGQRKSPILNTVLDALKELQTEEEERFRTEWQEYQKDLTGWEQDKPSNKEDNPAWLDAKPVEPKPLREFYVDKATIEAIDKIKGDQPDTSFIWIKDELSGLFSSYGAYKNGRGEDKQSILSGWNGRGIKKNLKGGERVSLAHDSMSIIGAIQDATLQKHMGNFDDDLGEWSRFLWTLIPLKAMRLPESDTTFQLAFLKDLYARARDLKPLEYKFAFDAQALYDNYHWKLEQRRVSHPQRGMRAAISKMEGYTARLALILHLIWELEAGKTEPALHIPRERVQAAIALSEFYLSQVTLIHSEGAAALGEGGLGKRLSAILDKLKQFGELTAGRLQSAISWLRKERADKLRGDLTELAKLGYGRLVGKGNRLKLVWDGTTTDTPDPTTDQTTDISVEAEMVDIREIELPTTDITDTTDINFDFCEQEEEQELGQEQEQEQESSEFHSDYQQHQDISSLPSTLDESTPLATDEISVEVSVVDLEVTPSAEPDAPAAEELADDPWMTEENIVAMAKDLEDINLCDNQEMLAILRGCSKPQVMNAAYERLSPERHVQIKAWEFELDCLGKTYRYTGNDYSIQKLCQANRLTVNAIKGDMAIVSSTQWHESITHEIPLSDLTEIEGV